MLTKKSESRKRTAVAARSVSHKRAATAKNNKENTSYKSQSSLGSEELDEHSVADEVVNPEAAAILLRELGRFCTTFKNFTNAEDDEESVMQMSHRSHDNIGYVRSPLIECASLEPDSVEKTDDDDVLMNVDAMVEVLSSEDDGLLGPDFAEDVSDDERGGHLAHGVEPLG